MNSFNDIAWTEYDESKRGIIAGALESGSLHLWDADKLLNGDRWVMRFFGGIRFAADRSAVIHWFRRRRSTLEPSSRYSSTPDTPTSSLPEVRKERLVCQVLGSTSRTEGFLALHFRPEQHR